MAYPLLEDPAAGGALAAVIDNGPAWAVEGLARHVGPVVSRLTRAEGVPSARMFSFSPNPQVLNQSAVTAMLDDMFGPVDDRTRIAGSNDLNALVDLYGGYEYQRIPTRRRLRVHLAGVLARLPVVVAEHNGQLVGAMRGEAMSEHTIVWDDSTVLPEYRGQKLSLAMMRRAMEVTIRLGRGAAGTVQPSNPIRIPRDLPEWLGFDPDGLIALFQRLRPPVRFRGQNRLRQIAEAVEGRRRPRPL
jgi:GNAT superfamily N-acetyltransferase